MANTIKVTYKVNEDGSLEKISKNAEKAARSTDKATQSKNRYNKVEKGSAQITSNSTKAFAKQAGAIGSGLVPAYATLAANVFAVTAAFGVLQRAAGIQQLNEGLLFTGRAAGQNLTIVTESLKEITGAAVSTAAAMKAVAIGVSAGFSQEQLRGLTTVAKGASLALGRDMTDALDRLIRGAAKLEPEILDELGIMVRLDQVTNDFAASVGKTASEVTNFEKRMAFTNAIIDQGTIKFGALAQIVDPNPYDKLAASFDDLTKTMLNFGNAVLTPVLSVLADNLGVLIGTIGIFGTSVVRQMIPALTEGGAAMAELANETANSAKEQLRSLKSFKGAPRIFDDFADSVANGTATEKERSALVNSLIRSENAHVKTMDAAIKKHGKDSKVLKEKEEKLANVRKARMLLTEVEVTGTAATTLNTRATALNAASQGSLKSMLISLRAVWAGELAATTANTAAKGMLTRALGFVRTGFVLATFSIRVFSIAIINAIPVIGQIILIASLAYEALSSFFASDPTPLEDSLERSKKRIEEFPNIINQMAVAYAVATSNAERFDTVLRGTSGILQQTVDQMAEFMNVQRSDQIAKQVKARVDLTRAQIALNKAEKEGANRTRNPYQPGGLVDYKSFQGSAEVKQAERDLKDAQDNINNINTSATIEGMVGILAAQEAAFQSTKTIATMAGEETTLLQQKIDKTNSVIEALTSGTITPEEAVKTMRAFNIEQQAIVQSSNNAAEAVSKVTALFAQQRQTTGFLADHIKALDGVVKNLADGGGFAVMLEKHGEALKAYGVTTEEELNTLLATFKEVNKATRESAVLSAESDGIAADLEARGLNILAAEERLKNTKREQLLLQSQIEALTKAKVDTTDLEVEKQKKLTQELKDQLDLINKRVAKARELGGDTMGGAADFAGGIQSAMASGGPQDASQAISVLNESSKGMLSTLRNISPEGEAMAAAMQGALNIAESWSMAFDQISKAGATTSDKLAAGMQAVGATISAISAMQQANAKADVAAVDRQIEAEKKRDGKSKESLAKIAAMEKKKESIKRKAFEQEKKMKMAEVVMATGVAIMNSVKMGLPWGAVFGAMAAAMGAAQLAAISSSTYDGGGASGVQTPSKISIGNRQNSVDLAKARSPSGELAYARGAQGTGTGMTNYTPAFTGAKYRAGGGNVGLMVGEQGPEMFIPDRPGTIVPADETQGFTGQPMNVNFSIQAIDSAGVEDLLMVQRGNIIGMIREAANSHGELFLENINDQSLPVSRQPRRY